ncbi:hypothetical protein GCM10027168_55620 [Streptomyces capparidis]
MIMNAVLPVSNLSAARDTVFAALRPGGIGGSDLSYRPVRVASGKGGPVFAMRLAHGGFSRCDPVFHDRDERQARVTGG